MEAPKTFNLARAALRLCGPAACLLMTATVLAQTNDPATPPAIAAMRLHTAFVSPGSGDTNALQQGVADLQVGLQSRLSFPNLGAGNGGLATNNPGAGPGSRGIGGQPSVQTQTAGPASQVLHTTGPLLNVDFGDMTKVGPAAVGQGSTDYWNPYLHQGEVSGAIQNLRWSDQSQSLVDVAVQNAPGFWANSQSLDPMYRTFIYPWDRGDITVTLNELPPGTYDFFVYAVRASDDGAPVVELQRAGVGLSIKGTTRWGTAWYSSYWDEYEQYVRFRNVAVANQQVVLEFYPDSSGVASLSGLQIVPSGAVPFDQPAITRLLNVDFAAVQGNKTGPAAVGLTAGDFWNADGQGWPSALTLTGLKWSDQTASSASLTMVNAPGFWGSSLPDPMLSFFRFACDGGNITVTLDGLPSGTCDVYLYGHTDGTDDNGVFQLWSDGVDWGTKGTSLVGPGFAAGAWEVGQQYVRFRDVAVAAGKPLVIHAKHTTYGFNNLSGLQLAYTGDLDSDANGLPDGWERRWFGAIGQDPSADPDQDGFPNIAEYRSGTDPTRPDSNANGISDLYDFEQAWVEDRTPQGGYEDGWSESWNWTDWWWDGDGWGGASLDPNSGARFRVSELVPNDVHQHYFDRALAVMRPAAGDVLYAYINLDSTYPPDEIMLQWYIVDENGNGSWEHRAFWGADAIPAGDSGTASRYPMGDLPASGTWVRTEVPAAADGSGVVDAILRMLYIPGYCTCP
jgi:hypothetical protein